MNKNELDFRKYRLRPLKAIRQHCLACSGFSLKEVRLCSVFSCSLYPYRFGYKIDIPLKKLKEVKDFNIKSKEP